jgi:ubiquinone/menaquinone biosynthesis C-methylase UbiE/uncharacterized protein YbaR (Trm112 family)
MGGSSSSVSARVNPELLRVLACPTCHGRLATDSTGAALTCTLCGVRYPVHLEIPILLPEALIRPRARDAHATHKERQIAFFDQESVDDFGITRPRGAPRLHGWLLREKFRRSILGLEDLLPNSSILTICGGSGVDAEFLAETGARVVLSDISLGVVLQARERKERFGLDMDLVVADAEALPFRDDSMDIVYVHDGLHHLEEPALGVAEMTRVARKAVSISEPAVARATAAAVRLRWAEHQEEAGNRVRRLTLHEIVMQLFARGFRPLYPHRYAMYYRHWPGRPIRLLSKPILFRVTTGLFRALNRVVGQYGNKLVVQAVASLDKASGTLQADAETRRKAKTS